MAEAPTKEAPLPWFAAETGDAEREAVLRVLTSNYINDGEVTREFETRVARLIGVEYCIAVTSGTAAITLALMGVGIGRGDEVLVPDLTFIATANAVRLAGADVKLVDVESERFAIDPERVEAAIGPRTRAIVPVDVNGRGADYEALGAICRKHGLRMVCDAAEGFGSRYLGKTLGSFGDAGCFSFSPAKTVTTGQGGMITTNDPGLHARLRELKDQGRRTPGTGGDDLHPVMGFNFKLTNLQAAVGIGQLGRLDYRLAQARRRDAWYLEALGGLAGVDVSRLAQDDGEIRQWADVLIADRSAVQRAFGEAGIGCRALWFPLHTQAPYAGPGDNFPNATAIARQGLWLPSAFGLTKTDVERVACVVRRAVGDR
jgi:perosamine synthetase